MLRIVLLNPAHYVKDLSKSKLYETHNNNCDSKFKEMLSVEKWMMSFHTPDNLRKFIIPSSLQDFENN